MEAGRPWYSGGGAFCHSKRESSQPADVLLFSSAYLHAVESAQKWGGGGSGGGSKRFHMLQAFSLNLTFIPFFLFSTWISNASWARSIVIYGDKRIDDMLPSAGAGQGEKGSCGGTRGGETPQWQQQKIKPALQLTSEGGQKCFCHNLFFVKLFSLSTSPPLTDYHLGFWIAVLLSGPPQLSGSSSSLADGAGAFRRADSRWLQISCWYRLPRVLLTTVHAVNTMMKERAMSWLKRPNASWLKAKCRMRPKANTWKRNLLTRR